MGNLATKKAIGQPEGLAELMVLYCERAAGFSDDIGLQDEGCFDARFVRWLSTVISQLARDTKSFSRYVTGHFLIPIFLVSSILRD